MPHPPIRSRPGFAVLAICAATALLLGAACTPRPVPRLERAMTDLEARYERARALPDRSARLAAYRALRVDVIDFRRSLDGEQVVEPNASVQASSDYGGGIGWVHVDRRDVESVRKRADRLLRSLDRYIGQPAAAVEERAHTSGE